MITVTSASPTNAAAQNQPHRRGCLFYVKRGLLTLVGLLAVLLILGFSYETIMAAGDAQRYPAPGQLVMVDGYSMHIRCLGEGSPTSHSGEWRGWILDDVAGDHRHAAFPNDPRLCL